MNTDDQEKDKAKKTGSVDVHNTGERVYHLPGGLKLEPGKSLSVPAEHAENLIGDNGYHDLMDASKINPGAKKREDDLRAELDKVVAENHRLKDDGKAVKK